MNNPSTKTNVIISTFFLLLFIANGAIAPLFSLFLKDLNFTGTEIGIIVSISPLMMLLVQPFWGYISDTTRRFHLILVVTIIVTAAIAMLFSLTTGFFMFLILSVLFALFQGAIEPVSTSLIMSYTEKHNLHYGNFRLWGAVGFAISVWSLGLLSQVYSFKIIFYTFSLFSVLSLFFAWNLPNHLTVNKKKTNLGNIKELLSYSPFSIFLVASFLMNGAMLANNAFYGIMFESLGGTLSGVGVSFLISVGCEIPSMRITGKLINLLGIRSLLILASLIAGLQYLCYYFHPSEALIYVLNVAQGFSVGVFIPTSLRYVQENTPQSLQTTAVGIYSGVGLGLGNWFFSLIGGIILDYSYIDTVYLLFSIVSFLGMGIMLTLPSTRRKSASGYS